MRTVACKSNTSGTGGTIESVTIIESHQKPSKMRHCGQHHKDVEYLVTAADEIDFAGILPLGPSQLFTVSHLLLQDGLIQLTAYSTAPKMYRAPCKITQPRPICRSMIFRLYRRSPSTTGMTADKPIPMNIAARKGLQSGVLKRGRTETAVHPMPSAEICHDQHRPSSQKA